ncbi:MAG: hypothetical protein KDA33_07930, partial [Phycisphaerales bacterium]|nr:hypothetical protein [Phycisphaerales bacterium]
MFRKRIRNKRSIVALAATGLVILLAAATDAPSAPTEGAGPRVVSTPYVVLGFNDLGMHCMNEDCS